MGCLVRWYKGGEVRGEMMFQWQNKCV
jgi:hypothetical protein